MRERMIMICAVLLLALSLPACGKQSRENSPAPAPAVQATPTGSPVPATPVTPPPSGTPATPSTPAGQSDSQKPRTFSVEQGDGMGDSLIFHATGDLKNPKVQYTLGGKPLVSTDLKLQANGEWAWSLPVSTNQRSEQVEIQLYSDGRLVGVAPMRSGTLPGQRWSSNFFVEPPRVTNARDLRLVGKARAFEAVFMVEIRHDGKRIARQTLHAKIGAPEYGGFDETLHLDGDIPAGSEVWFIMQSMKDGSENVELIAPLFWN